MVRDLNPTLLQRSIKVVGTGDWTWLFAITVDRSLGLKTVFQVTPWGNPLTVAIPIEADEPGYPGTQNLTFSPAPVAFREVGHDTQGTVGSIEVSISDPSRRAIRYTEYGQGFRGRELDIWAVNVQTLLAHRFVRATIRNVIVSESNQQNAAIVFHAEPPNLNDGEFPRHTVQAWRCDHRFAGERCGFRVTAATPPDLRVCDHSYRACDEHGSFEASQGRPRLHPDRFGATPGALTARGRAR